MEAARELIALLAAVLWIGILAPAILRIFGIPMAFGFWRLDRRNRHLSRGQYAWGFGVFSFGIGSLFLSALRDYLNWGRIPGRITPFSAWDLALRELFFWDRDYSWATTVGRG